MKTPDTAAPDAILIVDFGSQVTQLIARRIRETGVYCEIHPFQSAGAAMAALKPKAVVLSGSPASTLDEAAPPSISRSSTAVCRSWASATASRRMCMQLGGKVESGHHREFGRAEVDVQQGSRPFMRASGISGSRHQVWMSHGDRVTALPEGFEVVGTSSNAPYAFIADEKRRYLRLCNSIRKWCIRPMAPSSIANFVHNIAASSLDWTMSAYRSKMQAIREQVGGKRVICALSGGVDSSVAAVLIHEAVGDQLTCIYRRPRPDAAQDESGQCRRHVPRAV
jgi:GMP synthase (glutamine-hydrolysing)